MPCDICRRINHTTNYCYYKTPVQFPFDFSSLQWRGPAGPIVATPIGIPMYRPNLPFVAVQTPRPSMNMVSPTAGSFPTLHAQSQPFAGFTEAYDMPYMVPSSALQAQLMVFLDKIYLLPMGSLKHILCLQ